MLELTRMVLGPLQNNVVIIADRESGDAVVIDPSFNPAAVHARLVAEGWTLRQIWVTHAHGDHVAGAAALTRDHPGVELGVHPDSAAWEKTFGRSSNFGIPLDALPEATLRLKQGQWLALDPRSAGHDVEVREVPGHCPGSVIFHVPALKTAVVGDAVFRESIGRTDLPGGDLATLLASIRAQILTLPEETVLIPGHGPNTTVAHERLHNPYLSE